MNRLRWGVLAAVLIAAGIFVGISVAGLPLNPGCACGGPPPADPATVARVRASLPPLKLDGVAGAVGGFCWDGVCGSDEGLTRAPLVHSAIRVALPRSTLQVLGGMIFEPGDHWRALTVTASGTLGSSVGATYVEVLVKYQTNRSAEYVWRVK